MNIEDIKIGETYNVRVRIVSKCKTEVISVYEDFEGIAGLDIPARRLAILRPIAPAPKYDPCRKFRKGDIVRYVPHNGRECPAMPLDEYYRVKTLTVVEDEDANHNVLVETQDGRNKYIRFCFLELVTPVEELEPYSVVQPENYKCVRIMVGKRIHSSIPFDEDECVCLTLEQAKAAAEAECARLNAECRKEMEK